MGAGTKLGISAGVVALSSAEPSPAQIHFTNEQTEPFGKKSSC